jgi:hypothetical protein
MGAISLVKVISCELTSAAKIKFAGHAIVAMARIRHAIGEKKRPLQVRMVGRVGHREQRVKACQNRAQEYITKGWYDSSA